jgi:hypothetical protein
MLPNQFLLIKIHPMNILEHVFSGRIFSEQKIIVRDIYQVLTTMWGSPNAYSLQFCNEDSAKLCTSCRDWATQPSVMLGGFPSRILISRVCARRVSELQRTPRRAGCACFRTAVTLHWDSLASC